MLDLLTEGLESLRLPCSWVLLFPLVALTIYGRRRGPLVVGTFVAATALIAWLRFGGNWWAAPDWWLQIPIGAAVLVAAVVAWRSNNAWADAGLAALAAATATWAWIPCVGPELGELLNGARTDAGAHVFDTIAFVIGLSLPFIVVAAADVALPTLRSRLDRPRIAGLGMVLVVIFGLLFATTLFDDLASELARRSTF